MESIVKKVPRQATGSRRDPSDAARGRTTALVSEALISPRALLDLRERLAVECESFATRRGREKMWSWSLAISTWYVYDLINVGQKPSSCPRR